ncbi:hypothetical protein, partial [Thauera propionica]|uniref:hypothetical protein n=1 Tax=Thauera propionica TaxID=2019431 RepID=UPI00197E5FA6
MSINRIALICAALSLAGCAGFGQVSTSGLESVGPYPDNWESLVRDYIKTRFVEALCRFQWKLTSQQT